MEKATVIRHLRFDMPPNFDKKGEFHYNAANLGGITFLFELTYITGQDKPIVKYSFAQCHDDDNFNKKAGIEIATQKRDAGDVIKLDNYTNADSLVQNVFTDLILKAKSKDPIFEVKKLYRLRKQMTRIGNNLAECRQSFDEFIEASNLANEYSEDEE